MPNLAVKVCITEIDSSDPGRSLVYFAMFEPGQVMEMWFSMITEEKAMEHARKISPDSKDAYDQFIQFIADNGVAGLVSGQEWYPN